jgi:hypothetical protein
MTRNPAIIFILAILVPGFDLPAASQTTAELQNYFRDSIGLSREQIADIQNGKAVAKVLKSRTPAEIFVFGAFTSRPLLRVTSSLLVISTVCASCPSFWRLENSAILHEPLISRASTFTATISSR